MGVVCTAMLEVEPRYFLKEVREFHTWEKVRADLEKGEVLRRNRHYEVLFSPYIRKHAYPCLVTTRNRTESPENKWFDKRARNWAVELASAFPPHPAHHQPDRRPQARPLAVPARERDPGADQGRVRRGQLQGAQHRRRQRPAGLLGRDRRADGRSHIEAVERIIAVAAERRRLGEAYQSSPISFRFVKASPAYLSMMNGREFDVSTAQVTAAGNFGFTLTNRASATVAF